MHYVHGRDGLGDVVPAAEKADPAVVGELSSADQLVQWVTRSPDATTCSLSAR